MASYDVLEAEYLTLSDEFTELNKEYNRAAGAGDVPDVLELKFLKAERTLHDKYRVMQDVKAAEIAAGTHKPKKDK